MPPFSELDLISWGLNEQSLPFFGQSTTETEDPLCACSHSSKYMETTITYRTTYGAFLSLTV